MDKIALETSDGGYVTTAVIPPFGKRPDVLLWGDRVFIPFTPLGAPTDTYREAFAVAVVVTDDSLDPYAAR